MGWAGRGKVEGSKGLPGFGEVGVEELRGCDWIRLGLETAALGGSHGAGRGGVLGEGAGTPVTQEILEGLPGS